MGKFIQDKPFAPILMEEEYSVRFNQCWDRRGHETICLNHKNGSEPTDEKNELSFSIKSSLIQNQRPTRNNKVRPGRENAKFLNSDSQVWN